MNFVKSSLKYKQVTLPVLLMVFAVGIYSLLTMPRREDPKITVPLGLVVAYYPGATAAQVEEQVTKKIEQCLFQFEEIRKEKTYSTTRDGVVKINVEINGNVKKPDVFWNKLRHQLLMLKSTELPQGVRGPIVNTDFGDTEALLIAVESEQASYSQLKDYAQMLEDKLRPIHSASKIKRIGDQKEQIVISFHSEKMAQMGISLQQVIKILQSENTIFPSGELKTESNTTSVYTAGTYSTGTEIEDQIVGTSKTGSVVRLKDIADFKRDYAEQTTDIKVNGHKAIFVAVQMHEGNNIVWFGNDVNQKIEELTKQLPSNVKLTTIVNQPQMVDKNVSHFIREFILAIVSVIIVVLFLLPFHIAIVAAMAIPMTVAVTFATMHAFGIELHQVSLAALIVVLGMVVDDAIVVADNYVELLDNGIDRWTAAWRSAFDLIVPILAATLTIIASFMPMIMLTGALGEFIFDLPITVTIALASSFVVAMVLTPMLCFAFIKKGLHPHTHNPNEHRKEKKSMLKTMQKAYDIAIVWSVKHPIIVLTSSFLTIILAFIIFKNGVGQKFFPSAERNQFVIELWMPMGTKLDKTEKSVRKIEQLIHEDKRVVSYASFSGTSAPRVYYNFSPEFPISNYAQILVNTTDDETTVELSKELADKVEKLVPEGRPQVKLMQQGQVLNAPVEVRVFGDDVTKLKQVSAQIQGIINKVKGSAFVSDNFKEDYYGISIKLKEDAARLGFTTSSIAQLVYTGFSGYTFSTMYEGGKNVDIVLRLDQSKRNTTDDLQNTYLESPITGVSVPLRQIATIQPEWQPGQIIRRNGIRCITVQSDTKGDLLASQLLKEVQPQIEKLKLPNGFYIEYGGEAANKGEALSQMIAALGIGIVLIFVILLIQFHNLKEAGIIMLTIPLSLFGAIFGLFATHSNFGFTAFLGLISLSGIVVRNAIILIDHTNELLKEGMSIHDAAIESGKRRLRPIFLTAMAAAFGVLPMIISGSSLWAPLASVLAFGVTWSMIMALLTVPVLYTVCISMKDKPFLNEILEAKGLKAPASLPVALIVLGLLASISNAKAQQPEKLNLQKITDMAVQNNHILKIKKMQVNEKQQKIKEDQVKYFPVVSVGANYQHNSNLSELTIDKGSFGALPLGGTMIALPATNKVFEMGKYNNYNASATFYQPLTQLPKVKKGVQVSKTDLEITQNEEHKVNMQIKQAAEKLYFGLLILQKQKEEAELKLTVAKTKRYDAEGAILAGKATQSASVGLNASVADEQQNLLKLAIQMDDYKADLKHLIGMADSTSFDLETLSSSEIQVKTIVSDSSYTEAQSNNIDLKVAQLNVKKADFAISASNYNYLPDLGIIGGYTYQEGNLLYPKNNTFIGLSLKWNIQDAVSNTYTKHQRLCVKSQAEENIANMKDQVHTDISKANRRLVQSSELIAVAQKVVDYRKEDLKIQEDKKSTGLNLEADYLNTKAALAKAESDLFAAQLNYRIAYSDLLILMGKY